MFELYCIIRLGTEIGQNRPTFDAFTLLPTGQKDRNSFINVLLAPIDQNYT